MEKEKETSTQKTIQKSNRITSARDTIEDIIYICILAPLVFITLRIVFITLTQPNVIPDIFGFKIFMIFDDTMDESIKYGDLVITRNVNPQNLKVNDLMAFRNAMNTVTIKRINNINEIEEFDKDTNENKTKKIFLMNASENATSDIKNVLEENVEGLLVYKISKLGIIIYFIQQPLAMFGISCIILSMGLIWIYIAQQIDERENRIIENLTLKKEENV